MGENNQPKIPNRPKMTMMINAEAKMTAVIGPTLMPIDGSSKNLINPAPPWGMGAFPLLLFFRLEVLLDDIINIFNMC